MVIRLHASAVGQSVSQLTADFRRLMSPDTASRLRERRANKLKDYIAMSGPLGVTHLFLFSRSKNGNVHLRICLAPRGPTLTFRVEGYSLCKDVEKNMKRPRGGDLGIWANAPLVVMNNFAQASKAGKDEKDTTAKDQDPIHKQLETLLTTVFQGIFPAITPSSTRLDSIKRILLLNRETPKTTKTTPSKSNNNTTESDQGSNPFTLSLRHYAITTRQSNISKRVRRFDAAEQRRRSQKQSNKSSSGAALPNLGRLEDAADYLLDPSAAGYTSASDTELESENEVEVLETETHQRVLSRKQRQKLQDERAAAVDRNASVADADVNDEEDASQPDRKPDPSTSASQQRLQKRAIALHELGPRMELSLVKVEEGLCDGRVMWNSFVSKSSEETAELDDRWKTRRAEKEERRRVQRENVARKRGDKQDAGKNGAGEDEEAEVGSDFDIEDFEEMDMNGQADEDGEGEDGWEDQDGHEEAEDDEMED
ncbi:Ribosome biogenesis protein SSF1 [Cyphellophora attinorum]|uniref:Ribosome biogenesis protein SSF1 n=1 Tax=Cyphellophora attinorum TaxID=1664694 RepID=A0A0N1H9U8_9EURO|nr:Ribosome biogenesis protein SSF1 [Phialophora attinorum]KPI44522.1 Ribosome biogenesis protein SSF1 [Phialophora attinorum]